MRGKFITIEGGEGAGKSTNIPNIELFLQKRGIDYVLTREPGGTKMAEEHDHPRAHAVELAIDDLVVAAFGDALRGEWRE